MTQFVIIGDTENYKGCLVAICGIERKSAEKALKRMLNNPDDNDIALIGSCKNLRIDTVEEKDQWWNDPFLMSD